MTNFEIIARARGFELNENVVVNKGFYCVPVGDRDDSPTTYPTPEQAWEACCKDNELLPAVKKVCKKCGSDRVVVDAWACWSIPDQAWELKTTFGHSHCEDCDGETTIVDAELTAEDVEG